MDDESKILFYDRTNRYDISIRQYIKSHWIGIQIIFSGKNAASFYKLIKTREFNYFNLLRNLNINLRNLNRKNYE